MPEAQYERMWTRNNRLFSIIAMSHPTGALIFGTSVIGLSFVASKGIPDVRIALLLSLAMVFAQASSGFANDIFDMDLDKLSKPWRAMPMGHISIAGASTIAVLSMSLAVIISTQVSNEAAILLFLGITMGVLYSAILKRTKFSWVPYAALYPSLLFWVWVGFGKYEPWNFAIYPLAFPFVIGFHMVNQLRDFDDDLAYGIKGFVQHLRKESAVRLCFSLLLLSPVPFILGGTLRSTFSFLMIITASFLHWLLIAPLTIQYRHHPNMRIFRRIFKRLQLSGPLMMVAWLLGL